MPFKQIAENAIARGLSVIPLSPKEKKPYLPGWQNLASKEPSQIEKWALATPDANCGAVCSVELGNWILDVDDFNWFFESWPFATLPQTFTVRTGSGGLQFHFKHSAASRSLSNKSLKNPKYVEGVEDKTIKAAFLDVLIKDRQGVLPGSIHPNGNEYKVLADLPLSEISQEHLDWLQSLWDGKKTVVHKAKTNPIRLGVNIEDSEGLIKAKLEEPKLSSSDAGKRFHCSKTTAYNVWKKAGISTAAEARAKASQQMTLTKESEVVEPEKEDESSPF